MKNSNIFHTEFEPGICNYNLKPGDQADKTYIIKDNEFIIS